MGITITIAVVSFARIGHKATVVTIAREALVACANWLVIDIFTFGVHMASCAIFSHW